METVNGTPEKNTSGRYDNLCSENEQTALGPSGNDGSNNGAGQSSRFTENDSQWTDTTWKLMPIRDTTVGKILERIEALEARHIKYVDSHEARLNARLEAARVEKEEFLREANQIKSDLHHLAIAQQQANGNGHIK